MQNPNTDISELITRQLAPEVENDENALNSTTTEKISKLKPPQQQQQSIPTLVNRKSLEPISSNILALRERQSLDAPLQSRDTAVTLERSSLSPTRLGNTTAPSLIELKRRNSKLPRRTSGDKAKFQQMIYAPMTPLVDCDRKLDTTKKSPQTKSSIQKSKGASPKKSSSKMEAEVIIIDLNDSDIASFFSDALIFLSNFVVLGLLLGVFYFASVSKNILNASMHSSITTYSNNSALIETPLCEYSLDYGTDVLPIDYNVFTFIPSSNDIDDYMNAANIDVSIENNNDELLLIDHISIEINGIVRSESLNSDDCPDDLTIHTAILDVDTELEVVIPMNTLADIDAETLMAIDSFTAYYADVCSDVALVDKSVLAHVTITFLDYVTTAAVTGMEMPEGYEMSYLASAFAELHQSDYLMLDLLNLLDSFVNFIATPSPTLSPSVESLARTEQVEDLSSEPEEEELTEEVPGVSLEDEYAMTQKSLDALVVSHDLLIEVQLSVLSESTKDLLDHHDIDSASDLMCFYDVIHEVSVDKFMVDLYTLHDRVHYVALDYLLVLISLIINAVVKVTHVLLAAQTLSFAGVVVLLLALYIGGVSATAYALASVTTAIKNVLSSGILITIVIMSTLFFVTMTIMSHEMPLSGPTSTTESLRAAFDIPVVSESRLLTKLLAPATTVTENSVNASQIELIHERNIEHEQAEIFFKSVSLKVGIMVAGEELATEQAVAEPQMRLRRQTRVTNKIPVATTRASTRTRKETIL